MCKMKKVTLLVHNLKKIGAEEQRITVVLNRKEAAEEGWGVNVANQLTMGSRALVGGPDR